MADTLTQRLRAILTTESEPPLWTRSFLLVCGIHLLAYSSYAAVNPTFAVYLDTVTHSKSLVGVAFGVFTFAAVIARPLAGWLLDRVGRRFVQAVAAVALASATLSFTWVTLIWSVILLRALHGIAWGINSTATPTIAADVVPSERRSEGFGYFGVIPNVALMVLPPISLWVAHRFGFEAQFAGAAVLSLLALGPVVTLDDTAPATSSIGELYAREAAPAAVLIGLASVPLGAIDALLPLYAPTVGLANAGLFFTAMGAAIIIARSVLGQLPGSTSRLLLLSFLLQVGGLTVVASVPSLFVIRELPLGLLGGAALFGFGFALVFPLLQNVAVSATETTQNGSATATILIGMDLGIGVGAIVFGILADAVSFSLVYLLAALSSLGGAFVTVLLRPNIDQ